MKQEEKEGCLQGIVILLAIVLAVSALSWFMLGDLIKAKHMQEKMDIGGQEYVWPPEPVKIPKPEPISFSHKVDAMAHTKFPNETLSHASSFTLGVYELDTSLGSTEQSASASILIGSASLTRYGYVASLYPSNDPSTWLWFPAYSNWDADAIAAAITFITSIDMEPLMDRTCYVFEAKADVGGDPLAPNVDSEFYATGLKASQEPPPDNWSEWVGPTYFEVSGSIALNNVVLKGNVEDASSIYRQSPRSFRDRTAILKWYADGQSSMTVTVGDVSVTGNLAWSDEDIELNHTVTMTNFTLTYGNSPSKDTEYAKITGISVSAVDASLDLDGVNYWSTNGKDWTYSATEPETHRWNAWGDADSLHMIRTDTGDTDSSFTLQVRPKGPVAWNIEAERFGDTNYGYPSGLRFDGGLKQRVGGELVTVWLSPGTSPWYVETLWHLPGGQMPADLNTWSIPNQPYCMVDEDWLNDNDELLQTTVSVGGYETTVNNRDCPIAIPGVDGTWSTTDPFWGSAVTLTHADQNIDIPPGKTERPSLWTSTSANINESDNSIWVASTAGAIISRSLVTRYWKRLNQMLSRQPVGITLFEDWPIINKANWNDDGGVNDYDEEEWKTEIPVEDVTDWNNSSYIVFSFDSSPEIAEGQQFTLKVNYSTVSISSPWYTSYTWTYGPEGTWTYSRAKHAVSYTGTLSELNDGKRTVTFDLALPSGVTDYAIPKLMKVDSFELTLPTAGTYKLGTAMLVKDQSDHGYGDAIHNLHVQKAIDAWNWQSDYTGFGGTINGKPILQLTYGMEGKQTVQQAMKQHQERYHSPGTTATGDICYAKALSRLATELNYQQQLSAVYEQANVNLHTKDDDDNVIGALYWWDLERDVGNTVIDNSGSMDAAIRVEAVNILNCPTCKTMMNAHFYWHGRSHILARSGNQRVRGTGGSSDDNTTYDWKFWKKLKTWTGDEPDWVLAGSMQPTPNGRIITPPASENTYNYAISNGLAGDKIVIGSYSSRQFVDPPEIAAISSVGALAYVEHAPNITFLFIYDGEQIKHVYSSPPDFYYEHGITQSSYVLPRAVVTSTDGSPSGYFNASGKMYFYHMFNGSLMQLTSSNYGNTFDSEGVMISGESLTKGFTMHKDGISYAVCINSNSDAFFYRSNTHFADATWTTDVNKFLITTGCDDAQPSCYTHFGNIFAAIMKSGAEVIFKCQDGGKTWTEVT